MATRSDVDHLRGTDLNFELEARGQSSDGAVVEKRSRLRLLMQAGIEMEPSNISEVRVGDEINKLKANIEVLVNDIADLKDTCEKNDVLRFCARFRSMKRRVELLKLVAAEQPEHLATIANVEEKLALGNKIFQKLNEPPLADKVSELTAQAQSQVVAGASNVTNIGTEDANDYLINFQPNFPEMGGAINQDIVACPGNNNLPILNPPLNIAVPYSKLPHPASRLISNIPKADGFDTDNLLKFFKAAYNIYNSFADLRHNLLSLLIPFTSGPLLDCLCRHISQNNFIDFHKEALNSFVPSRQYDQLKANLYLRCQSVGEPLSTYILSIKEAACVLLINASEAEVVNTIIEGINSEVRSCLVFSTRPASYAELDRLCIQVMNVLFTDKKRESYTVATKPSTSTGYRNFRSAIICHNCKQPGHIRPNCPKPIQHNANFNSRFASNLVNKTETSVNKNKKN